MNIKIFPSSHGLNLDHVYSNLFFALAVYSIDLNSSQLGRHEYSMRLAHQNVVNIAIVSGKDCNRALIRKGLGCIPVPRRA